MVSIVELKAKARRLRWEQRLNQLRDTQSDACPAPTPCRCASEPKRLIKKPVLPRPAITLIAPAPPKNLRNHDYNLAFEQGTARWYHFPVSSVQNHTEAQMRQIRFCALGTTSTGMGERSIRYVWRVKSVQQLPRHQLTIAQSGALKASETPYWLLEFEDHPICLKKPVMGFPQHFELKLSLFSHLVDTPYWHDIPDLGTSSTPTTGRAS